MNNVFDSFTDRYSVSKTLRFSLIPMYETAENIKRAGFLEADEKRAEDYKVVKALFDRYHRDYIERKLSAFHAVWTPLFNEMSEYRTNKNAEVKDKIETLSVEICGNISKTFTDDLKSAGAANLIKNAAEITSPKPEKKANKKTDEETPEKIRSEEEARAFTENLKKLYTEDELRQIAAFNTFAGYFLSYDDTRENMYKPDIHASVAYRIVL